MPHGSANYEENLRNPLAVSLTLHVTLALLALGFAWWRVRSVETFGEENPGAGAYSVQVVKSINIAQRQGRVNPVADDTESEIERAPEEKEKKKPIEKKLFDDDGIVLDDKPSKRKERTPATMANANPDPNRVSSSVGQATVSPIFKQIGGGGIGIGPNAPLGLRFGWYAELLRQRISEHWRQDEISPSLKTSNPAIVKFEILRDGSIRNARIVQPSGIPALDYSAQRAIQEAAPFPELPRQFERDSATIEFWFELKR